MVALANRLGASPHFNMPAHYQDEYVQRFAEYVRDNLGHESISTTSQYLHADDDDRHRATESGLKMNW